MPFKPETHPGLPPEKLLQNATHPSIHPHSIAWTVSSLTNHKPAQSIPTGFFACLWDTPPFSNTLAIHTVKGGVEEEEEQEDEEEGSQ